MKLKVYPPVLAGLTEALRSVFDENHYADKVLERIFKSHPKWGRRDRRIVAEGVYEIVRNYLALRLIAEKLQTNPIDPYLKLVQIWMEAFQEDFELPQNPLAGKKPQILKIFEGLQDFERDSFPEWLNEELQRQRGPRDWKALRAALNEQAPVFLRANLLKADAEDVARALREEDYQVEVVDREALRMLVRRNIFPSSAFQSGFFEVQDLHSQKVVDLLDPQPGECVIDACAGAGGKTLHISSRMDNKGKVIALDVLEPKLLQLKKRARRAGVHNLEIKWIESSKTIKRLEERADRLLLDVPCSGLGVLRRNPDTKWKLTKERLKELEKIQREILNDYAKMLKPGGIMVYSTCSILPSENVQQIDAFLTKNQAFELVSEKEFLPGLKKGDGFYVAVLKKFKTNVSR
jgi:16S rRNA (cytosine967-C5)-methyltransferase